MSKKTSEETIGKRISFERNNMLGDRMVSERQKEHAERGNRPAGQARPAHDAKALI